MKISFIERIPNSTDLYNLYEYEHWNDFLQLSKDQLYTAMKNSWYILSVYHGDKLIGTGRVVSDGMIIGYITGLIVHPDYRNRGIGRDIMQKLIAKCNQSYLTIQLLTANDCISFYQQLGFQSFANGLIYVER
ncbi:GNAT family N-acetyltransferase [Shimazuella sp. AN120528]|uniref:GNAT family N-acetyltransferase n=1 Tax=Shimazuella soli TaxID=1892854 RepID=UPI001F0F1225|nr:GNAT family N-acetyltransferase [Shimazuella soli]MCH5585419.1 GNAT family N-acetyltransferase [Shimazuella soli]